MTICSVFWKTDDLGINLQEWYSRSGLGELLTPCVSRSIGVFSVVRLALNMPCQAVGAGRATRGDRKLGANDYQGASWNEELDGEELRGAPGSERNL